MFFLFQQTKITEKFETTKLLLDFFCFFLFFILYFSHLSVSLPPKLRKMKKLLVAVIIIGIAILMALTVPDKKAHKEAMMNAVKEYVDEEAEERGIADNGITRFGKNVVNKAIEGTLGTMLKVNNYYLFNTTQVKVKGKNQLLSVGILGQVITFNKNMLRETIENAAVTKKEAKAEKKELKAKAKAEKKRLKEERKKQKKLEKEARKRARQEAKKKQENKK